MIRFKKGNNQGFVDQGNEWATAHTNRRTAVKPTVRTDNLTRPAQWTREIKLEAEYCRDFVYCRQFKTTCLPRNCVRNAW